MDIIQSRDVQPDIEAIPDYIGGEAGARWRKLTEHIERSYGSKPQIVYSVCSGKSGWNVKYKKSRKALCTLYPEKGSFIALVVLSAPDMDVFDAVKKDYTQYVTNMYDNSKPFNNTKWLMIRVTDDNILEDVKMLLKLKLSNK